MYMTTPTQGGGPVPVVDQLALSCCK